MSTIEPVGRHLLADLCGVPPALLSDAVAIEAALRAAAADAGATVLFGHVHPFGDGQGVTGVLLLMESHISIHTWPEHGFAAVDVFMCGDARPELALASLQAFFAPADCIQRLAPRGLLRDS
ncbi:adenosylmethionine decarboxylase [Jeongeupia wiesaeckerbachi]|uniref:adenosylmethionine decarboxylase n=1 Tax=Jeongeupia wiesaeckerbachi TaxID=3051218 RepID=UPI003D8094A2